MWGRMPSRGGCQAGLPAAAATVTVLQPGLAMIMRQAATLLAIGLATGTLAAAEAVRCILFTLGAAGAALASATVVASYVTRTTRGAVVTGNGAVSASTGSESDAYHRVNWGIRRDAPESGIVSSLAVCNRAQPPAVSASKSAAIERSDSGPQLSRGLENCMEAISPESSSRAEALVNLISRLAAAVAGHGPAPLRRADGAVESRSGKTQPPFR